MNTKEIFAHRKMDLYKNACLITTFNICIVYKNVKFVSKYENIAKM